MAGLDAYILSVTAAAILCALSNQLAGNMELSGRIIRLICGVIMTVVIIRPVIGIKIPDLTAYFLDIESQTYAAVSAGTRDAYQQLSQRIAQQTRAYILEKAEALGVTLELSVQLDSGNPPVPIGVVLQGSVSPSVRSALTEIISKDLGIRKEDQIWK